MHHATVLVYYSVAAVRILVGFVREPACRNRIRFPFPRVIPYHLPQRFLFPTTLFLCEIRSITALEKRIRCT